MINSRWRGEKERTDGDLFVDAPAPHPLSSSSIFLGRKLAMRNLNLVCFCVVARRRLMALRLRLFGSPPLKRNIKPQEGGLVEWFLSPFPSKNQKKPFSFCLPFGRTRPLLKENKCADVGLPWILQGRALKPRMSGFSLNQRHSILCSGPRRSTPVHAGPRRFAAGASG